MGGKILEFKGEKEWNAGEARGRLMNLVDMVNHGMLTAEQAEKTARKLYGTSPEDFRKLFRHPEEEERMQG